MLKLFPPILLVSYQPPVVLCNTRRTDIRDEEEWAFDIASKSQGLERMRHHASVACVVVDVNVVFLDVPFEMLLLFLTTNH